ncbi:threonine aldolase family protein [Papillibacter cinnamivorans]|uniref:L-threonine aldolase n=1 Tax=Papillibacter cinnamivorans DSM 12816 TaxID=1122930 RepID=A0A1W1ZGW7_9FIRM|nr:aminotransferase class I/II-fold pyridoxal phosphate-dependent enzyme [Papillibacter cinnamivorans]SMC47627.1 L-threonine aldolase [Papillibacter cinnamivorans DSM 12816]
MHSFKNDYSEGAHPRILKALEETNLKQTDGYGLDPYCRAAADLLRARMESDAEIHFFVGGTQANLTALAAFLRPHEAAISPSTGHINVHETGAVEATGHKVLTVPAKDGKLTPKNILPILRGHSGEHMVRPRLVYISDSTEVGTVYTKGELEALSRFCKETGLYLYLDGARLGSALTAPGSDLTLPDLARLTDAFYVGGTKNGALFGEAMAVCNPALREDFRFLMKQRGAILAKGRLLGLQFEALFRDDLYFELARHANRLAARLQDGIAELGYPLYLSSPTNQLFPLFPEETLSRLSEEFSFETMWAEENGGICIRLVTSWATPESAVDACLKTLKAIRDSN